MDIIGYLSRCPDTWRPAPPASKDDLARLVTFTQIQLPNSYLTFLAASNGGEGDLALKPGWISFWPANEVSRWNAEYQVARNVPGLIGFGSNGGGELLAFDTRLGPPYAIVMVPFVPMAIDDLRVVAPSFDALLSKLGTRLPAA